MSAQRDGDLKEIPRLHFIGLFMVRSVFFTCVVLATASSADAFNVVAPRGQYTLSPTHDSEASQRSRVCASPAMLWRGAKGIPKGKVPDKTKADE